MFNTARRHLKRGDASFVFRSFQCFIHLSHQFEGLIVFLHYASQHRACTLIYGYFWSVLMQRAHMLPLRPCSLADVLADLLSTENPRWTI